MINLLFILASAYSQEPGTCYQQTSCRGSTQIAVYVPNLERYCCRYSSPGITRGYSYQHFGIETCFMCPRSKFQAISAIVNCRTLVTRIKCESTFSETLCLSPGISVNYLSAISPFCLLIYMCMYVRHVMCKYIFIVELISLFFFQFKI